MAYSSLMLTQPRRFPLRSWSQVSRRTHTTVFPSHPPIRAPEKRAALEAINKILYLLRTPVGRVHGLNVRDDGLLSVKELLNYPEFHSLDMKTLQRLILDDRKHRIELILDPSRSTDDHWWLRAKEWNEKHLIHKTILNNEYWGEAVYTTTIEEWNSHISRNGIPKTGDHIELMCNIPTIEYLDSLKDESQVFIFIDIPASMQAGLRFSNATPTTQKWSANMPIITKGDQYGYIPPSHFTRVEHVTARKKLIYGDPKPLLDIGWSMHVDESEAYEQGKRRTFLRPVNSLHGFIDGDQTDSFDFHSLADRSTDSGLREEARALLMD